MAPEEDPLKFWLEVDKEVRSKGKYDFHIFEDLGLKMKHQITKNYEIIWCRNKYRLQEYFYNYRKMWKDQAKMRGVGKTG